MNIVRCRNGMELVWRGSSLWRRPTPTSAWTAGASPGGSSGGLLLLDPTDDVVTLLGDTLAYTHDEGLTLNATPGQSLPATVLAWSAAGLKLTDAHVWHDGFAAAIGTGFWRAGYGWDPDQYALYTLGMDGSTATRILGYSGEESALGTPVLFRDTANKLLAFRRAVADRPGGARCWSNVTDAAGPWTDLYLPGAVVYPELVRCCGWQSVAGLRVVAGYDPDNGRVRVVQQGGVSWLQASLAVVTASAVDPYIIETTGGGFEVGWLESGAWKRWECTSIAGAWTQTEGA